MIKRIVSLQWKNEISPTADFHPIRPHPSPLFWFALEPLLSSSSGRLTRQEISVSHHQHSKQRIRRTARHGNAQLNGCITVTGQSRGCPKQPRHQLQISQQWLWFCLPALVSHGNLKRMIAWRARGTQQCGQCRRPLLKLPSESMTATLPPPPPFSGGNCSGNHPVVISTKTPIIQNNKVWILQLARVETLPLTWRREYGPTVSCRSGILRKFQWWN